MQWFVETTIVVDGAVKKAYVDVVPIVGPVAARVPSLGAEEALHRFNARLDGAEEAHVYKTLFPGGSGTPPKNSNTGQRRMVLITGWRPEAVQKKIVLIKIVRAWTGLDLLTAKRTVDELDYGRGSFRLDLENTAAATRNGMSEADLFRDLDECGVIYREASR